MQLFGSDHLITIESTDAIRHPGGEGHIQIGKQAQRGREDRHVDVADIQLENVGEQADATLQQFDHAR